MELLVRKTIFNGRSTCKTIDKVVEDESNRGTKNNESNPKVENSNKFRFFL